MPVQAGPPSVTARRGSNSPRVGDYNQVVVLEAIRRHGEGLSRVELSASTGLSAQAVSNICRRLIDEGLVVEAGKLAGRPGKPRTLLRLDPAGGSAVGVHLDPAVMTFVVLDLTGRVVARSDRALPTTAAPERVLAQIAEDVAALVAASGVDRERIVGLGVAAPGPVDSAAGALIHPPNLPGWERVAVRDALASAAGLPVLLDKDVVAAAVAEVWAGGVGGSGNAVLVYLGTGVGAGLVLRGEVHRGASGNAGEVGNLLTRSGGPGTGPGGPARADGPLGRLGDLCAPRTVVRTAGELGLGRWDLADPLAVDSALTDVCALAAAGDPAAAGLLERWAVAVAGAVTDLVDLLDLEQVVFGGPLWSRVEGAFLRVVPGLVQASAVAGAIHPVTVRGTRIGADVAAVGAACLALDEAFSPSSTTLLLRR